MICGFENAAGKHVRFAPRNEESSERKLRVKPVERINRTKMERPFSGRGPWIEQTLEQLDFVQWDRWYELGGHLIAVFGWIDREDQYKDFVLLEINVDRAEVVAYYTSSAEYTEKIGEILNMDHSACKRVEDYLDVENAVMLQDDLEGFGQNGGDNG